MSNNPFKHLVAKVKYMLYLESKLDLEECAQSQWQMFCKWCEIQYIFGRGGANTCFYQIGNGERQVCYPDELVKWLDKLSKQKFGAYAICDQNKKIKQGLFPSLDDCKDIEPKKAGLYIVGLDERGKFHRLMYSSVGLERNVWLKFTPPKR